MDLLSVVHTCVVVAVISLKARKSVELFLTRHQSARTMPLLISKVTTYHGASRDDARG